MAEQDPKPAVTLIGGGTGAPSLLLALAGQLPEALFSMILPVTDTGRSTGTIRRSLPIPGPGDIRHCLATLAEGSEWGRLLELRVRTEGPSDLDGMPVGNLALAALTQWHRNLGEATSHLARLLSVPHRVLPVSVENIHLAATLIDGSRVDGELQVRRPGKAGITRLEVTGQDLGVWPPVADALEQSDWIIVGPGSLWTSIGAVLSVKGVSEAIERSSAVILFVCNSTQQPGQTDGLGIVDHVGIITQLLGKPPDAVIVNSSPPVPARWSDLRDLGLWPLLPDRDTKAEIEASGSRLIVADLLATEPGPAELWQKLHTAYHDMDKLAALIAPLISSPGPPTRGPAKEEGRLE